MSFGFTSVVSNLSCSLLSRSFTGNIQRQMGGGECCYLGRRLCIAEEPAARILKLPDLVRDAFARAFSTVNVCQLPDMCRPFVGDGKSGAWFERSMAELVEVYVRQLVNDKSDVRG